MTEKWKGQTRGGVLGYLFFVYLIQFLGVRVAYIFLSFVVVYFIPFAPKATKSTWQYSRKILKNGYIKSIGFLFLNYYRLGQILIDKVAIGAGKKDQYHFEFENYTGFLDLLDSDMGVIMIGAHVGNWEIGVPFFDEYAKKINIVMYDNEHERIKAILEKNQTTQTFKVIAVNKDSFNHVFEISKALNNKEYICFQGDRYVSEEKVLESTLLNKKADFPLGPFLLASKMKTPVVFYFAMREPGMTYRFYFYQADLSYDSKEGMQILLNQYTSILGSILQKYPEQWFNYYSFWKN